MHIPRRHLNYANVVATLALVFAMSGGALAAKHYLINSTKQINPKVLKKLKGNAGKTGATGPAGVAGAPGPQGKEGSAGKEGTKGAPGSAVAYAHIESSGTIDASQTSSNITGANVSHVALNNYQFSNLPFTVHSVIVSLGFGNHVNDIVIGQVTGEHSAEAATYSDTKSREDASFYIVFN
jgi:Collagen triple helix repeat (20 copies)